MLWVLLTNETYLDMWTETWPEGGETDEVIALDIGQDNSTDILPEWNIYPTYEQLVQLDMVHICILEG